ncbi:hypothetical protein TNIN_244961 [Trichonephila inaurata madagascariensis]|uniref:Uncharacterized protein n=1 Tax=Trichonephila inaurata madagascariensis TaxID=2747483 RepID=A0A8X6Y685_9ARAC|nr:hypothetical protein TNIN_244961 [Trichonephila inaurata madagascariensis]
MYFFFFTGFSPGSCQRESPWSAHCHYECSELGCFLHLAIIPTAMHLLDIIAQRVVSDQQRESYESREIKNFSHWTMSPRFELNKSGRHSSF